MASHYDPAKNCRVGTMDEQQFYGETTKTNGAYFGSLINAWTKKGGGLRWGAGGVGLRLPVEGRHTGICFLAPAYAGKKDRIELSLTTLARQIGAGRSQALEAALQRAAGDRLKGSSMISIADPGELTVSGRKALTGAFERLFSR
jgi:hypothetical protein